MTENPLAIDPDPSSENFGRKLKGLLHTYRLYWMAPLVLGFVLLSVVQVLGDSETIGRFRYFNF